MEPALAAVVFRACIPCKRQNLQAPARQFDKILLQGLDTERVFDRIFALLPVITNGLHDVLPIALKKPGDSAEVFEGRVRKVSEHGIRLRLLYGEVMVRSLPGFCLAGMAAGAAVTANERGHCIRQ